MWGTWGMPMWGFGWLIPLIGLAVCLAFLALMIRAMTGGGGFMCMGHHAHDKEVTDLRREVRELRDALSRLKASR